MTRVQGLGASRVLREGGVKRSDAIELSRRKSKPKPKPPKRKPRSKGASAASTEDALTAIVKAWQNGDAEAVLRLYPRAMSAARKGRGDGARPNIAKVTAIRLWAREQTGR